jgi:hypothetical protein
MRDKEISVTKFVPSEQQDNSTRHHRLNPNTNHRYLNPNKQSDRIITTSIDPMRLSCTRKLEQNSSEIVKIFFSNYLNLLVWYIH